MPKIHVLPDILASQVAAGEVVERPASVVKELVENSIDAGAREIRVDIDRGGAGLIRVSDDGCGMSREDALLSLERHATSKLRSAAGLAAILTLGFRGEAVPSIASVSRFRLVTREPDSVAGTEILVDGGKVRDVRDAGCAPGTMIEAKSLFYNLPARRKFMRAESTEAAHIEHQLRLHALAAPNVRFRLRRDDREVFDLPPAANALERVRQLLGTELSRELIPLPRTRGNGIVVEGHVLPAAHARKGRRHQFVFLNGRPVEDGMISRALVEGFRGSLSEGLHPAAWLWIELDPALVDVNVHPAKREVRFHRPGEIKLVILESVIAGLRPTVTVAPPTARRFEAPSLADLGLDATEVKRRLQAPAPEWVEWVGKDLPPLPDTPETKESAAPPAPKIPDFRILGMLLQRFVLLESADGLVIFDPKAARERIIYEKVLAHGGSGMAVQGLLVPVLLDLDPRDLDLVLRERVALQEAGIEVASFGGNTLRILGLPSCVELEHPREFLGALMDELLHESAPGSRFAVERLARVLARRAADLVQPRLAETTSLLTELFACELPYCAADGRPTLTEYSMRELERRLGISKG